MKKLKHTIAVLLIVSGFSMQAGWPGNTSSGAKDKAGTVLKHQNTNGIFAWGQQSQARTAANYLFHPANTLPADYITGHTEKAEKPVIRILNWDFKVKFRLNKNMNIIFSYN